MKIFINGRFLSQKLSGVQTFSLSYADKLYEIYGSDLTVLFPKRSKISNKFKFPYRIKKIGINTGHIWEQFDLPLYLRSMNFPLLINLGNSSPVFYKNKFTTIHDLSVYKNKRWHNVFYRTFYKLLIPLIIKRNLRVLTVSKFSRKEIIKKFKIASNSITVIPNALTIDHGKSNVISSKRDYFLFVGSLNRRKNVGVLIKAFNLIDNKKIKLKLVGLSKKEFTYTYGYQSNVEPLGNVYGEELHSLYVNSNGLIFPSHYEGFGIPLIEAMLLGVPILCSNIEVFNEVCNDAAIYFNQNDEIEIKNKILDIYNNKDLISDLVKRGRYRVNDFNIDKCVKIFQKEIDQLQ